MGLSVNYPEDMATRKELLLYLTEWRNWARAGGKPGHVFQPTLGLCQNAGRWGRSYFFEKAVWKLFQNEAHPFGAEDYLARMWEGSQHLCPKRLAWVDSAIADLETLLGGWRAVTYPGERNKVYWMKGPALGVFLGTFGHPVTSGKVWDVEGNLRVEGVTHYMEVVRPEG